MQSSSLCRGKSCWLATILMLFLVVGIVPDVRAQGYPSKPIRIIVASAAGGGTDFVARALNDQLSKSFGQPVIVDNRGGAGGVVGADLASKSPSDGYTLLMTFVNFTIYPSLYRNLPFDPVRDFAPVTLLATTPLMMVVNPQLPATSVKELIALGKSGAKLNYATPGAGSLNHLSAELLKKMTGMSMTHVPYKGGGPSILALLGNEVQLYFSTMPAALTQVKAGRLRALAVTSEKRAATAPTVPTVSEAGVPGYVVNGWFGLLAPARTPHAVTNRINHVFTEALAMPAIKGSLATEGLEPSGGTAAQFASIIKSDIEKWSQVMKQAGIKAE